MPETVTRIIGPGGDFETLAAFAVALPPSLVVADQIWVALIGKDAVDPGGATFRTICDAQHYVEIRAAPGQSFSDVMDPETDPLRPTEGKGALIRTGFGDALRVENVATRVRVIGLQIVAEDGAALSDDGDGAFVRVERCLIEARSSAPAVSVRSPGSLVTNAVVIQQGSGHGITLGPGTEVGNSMAVKPNRAVADGFGFEGIGTPFPNARSCVAFGFRQAFNLGFNAADSLVSDQTNVLPVATNLADPYWVKVSSTVAPASTIPGPYNVPLQFVGNNLNAFARFEAASAATVQPGKRIEFSVIVAQPTALVSAIVLNSIIGTPEVRVTWGSPTPLVELIGQADQLQLIDGGVDDLGGDTYRLWIEAQNTSTAGVTAQTVLYVTRGQSNQGLLVGMYAGCLMAGLGHLGAGFVEAGALPGTNREEGVDPDEAVGSVANGSIDLRPTPGGRLNTVAAQLVFTDVYDRLRAQPDMIGPVTLNPATLVRPATANLEHRIDPVRLIDQDDVLNAQRQRTVLPASQSRRVGV